MTFPKSNSINGIQRHSEKTLIRYTKKFMNVKQVIILTHAEFSEQITKYTEKFHIFFQELRSAEGRKILQLKFIWGTSKDWK